MPVFLRRTSLNKLTKNLMPQLSPLGALGCSERATLLLDLSTVNHRAMHCSAKLFAAVFAAPCPHNLTSNQVTPAKTSAGARRAAAHSFRASCLSKTSSHPPHPPLRPRASSSTLAATRAITSWSCRRCFVKAAAQAYRQYRFTRSRRCLKTANSYKRSVGLSRSLPPDSHTHPLCLQLPLVVELGTRVRLHCAALGDSDGSVTVTHPHALRCSCRQQVVFESNGLVGDEGAKMHASGAATASTAGNGLDKTRTV